MIKKKLMFGILLLTSLLLMIVPANIGATSWVFPFVVWNDSVYVISSESVTDVGKSIGKVTSYSDMEQFGGNFSNIYEKGTKYYAINGISTDIAIAVEEYTGRFLRADYESAYTFKEEPIQYFNKGLLIMALAILALIGYPLIKKYFEKSK